MRDDIDIKERLYRLLPSIYRQRDQAQGYTLRAFMNAMEREFLLLEADMDRLYENWFIETADDWVIPYIGDLLGVADLAEKKNEFFSQRRLVANTTGYRRRKGLPAVLEHVAQDVTGWPARVVEYRQLLATTQHLSHARPSPMAFIDLRQTAALAQINGPFDTTAHTVDVRQMGMDTEPDISPASSPTRQGKYRPDSLGLFLWRLQSYQMTNVPAGSVTRDTLTGRTLPSGCFTFDPLQRDLQLFSWPQEVPAITGRSTIINTPDPISRAAFASDLKAYATSSAGDQASNSLYYGPDRSLSIILDGVPLPPNAIISADLSLWQPPYSADTEKPIAVDVELGRIMVLTPEGKAHSRSHIVETTYSYGFNGEVGGGPYIRSLPPTEPHVINVIRGSRIDTLGKALAEWEAYCEKESKPACTIRILDNRTYAERNLVVTLPNNSRLVIEAAHGLRPSINLIGHMHIRSAGEYAYLSLNGLLINSLLSLQGNMQLDIVHCTATPYGIETHHTTSRTTQFQMMIDHSIVGPLRLQRGSGTLQIQDSIIDGMSAPAITTLTGGHASGIVTHIERSTIFGPVQLQELRLARDVIFTAPVYIQGQNSGLVSYSYIPESSQTPRRHRCQPDLALAQQKQTAPPSDNSGNGETSTSLQQIYPLFTSSRYGDPGYAQLSTSCASEILRGAEDGSEMGVFHDLRQIQRQDNVYRCLDEYFPFHLAVTVCFVN